MMPKNYTIEEQLEQLIIQKNALEDILKDKGVEVNDDETFNSLISKVNELETGSLGVYSLPITTFTSNVTNQTVDFNWTLPVDDARSGVVICYSDVEVPQEVGDNIWYDSETLSGTTTTSLNSVFPTGGTWYTTIFTYTMINNKRVYTKGPSLTFDCIPKGLEIFKASGTFTVPKGTNSVDIFLVGGGAGGNSAYDGGNSSSGYYYNGGNGGNGGRVLTQYGVAVTPFDTIEVVVGAGGSGGRSDKATTIGPASGSAGESSTFGSYSSASGSYRSGGVRAIYHTSDSSLRQDGTAGTDGQYAFGDSTIDGIKYGASGGGGGARQTYTSGKSGGATGGGKGGSSGSDGSSGTKNTGGGGGGAGYGDSTYGGSGGSGIVIVRWGY